MPKRFGHNLSHYRLASFDMGLLVPVSCMEVLPGDVLKHGSSVLLRIAPLVKPLMHPVDVRLHHFFVPNRLLWSDWDTFITGQGGTFPTINYVNGTTEYTLLDHLGKICQPTF